VAVGEEKALNVGPSGIEVAYERFGHPGAPPVLLMMGGGAQMTNWPEGFCAELVSRGVPVIRFDSLPRQLWPELATRIAGLVQRAEAVTATP
jgi:hypothetical protein